MKLVKSQRDRMATDPGWYFIVWMSDAEYLRLSRSAGVKLPASLLDEVAKTVRELLADGGVVMPRPAGRRSS